MVTVVLPLSRFMSIRMLPYFFLGVRRLALNLKAQNKLGESTESRRISRRTRRRLGESVGDTVRGV